MITAHSGCDKTGDNSVNYIEYVINNNAEAFEIDIRRSNRGELILSHDEVYGEVVSLATAFEMVKNKPKIKINCDFKLNNLERETYELAKKYNVEDRLIFTGAVDKTLFKKGTCTFKNVMWFANLEIFASYEEIDESEDLKATLLDSVERMKNYEVCGINWYYENAKLVLNELKNKKVGISVWTVDSPMDTEFFLKNNVDNITTRNLLQAIMLKQSLSVVSNEG